MKHIWLLACFLFTISISAQNIGLGWVKTFGINTAEEFGASVSHDAAGNVYTTGYFGGTVDFDPGPGTFFMTESGGVGFYDVFIQKLDASGNFVWAKQIGSTNWDLGYSITNDAGGNVYIAGRFEGTVDFDPGPSSYTVFSAANSMDVFVCKLDPNGNFLWVKTAGGVDDDVAYSVFVDSSGNIYTTGFFEGIVDFDPGPGGSYLIASSTYENVFIQKLDASGNFVWAKAFGVSSSGGRGNSIIADTGGNVYICGSFGGTVDFDPGPGTFTMTGIGDAFICKLDALGNFDWAQQITGPSAEYGISVNSLPGGNILFSGNYSGGADLDPGPATYTTNTNYGGSFFTCFDGAGNLIWRESIDNSAVDRITLHSSTTDALGNIYSTGYFQGTVDFNMGTGTYSFNAMTQDIFIQKIDAAGNFITAGAITVGNSSSGRTGGNGITCDNSANVYVTGYFDAIADFDPGPFTNTISAINYKGDVFVLKLNPCTIPSFSGSILGSATVCSGNTTTYSISLAAGALGYNWSFPSGWTGTSTTNITNPIVGAVGGSIIVTAVNGCGYSSPITTIVSTYPSPTITITGSSSVCVGNTLILSGNGANTYSWSTSSLTSTIAVNPMVNTNYTLTGTDLNGCKGVTTKSVIVQSPPSIFAGTMSSNICAGQTTTLYVGGADSYSWASLGTSQTPTINPSTTTIYTVTGTSLNGCSTTTTVVQNVSACSNITEYNNSNSLNVFPNPFNSILILKSSEDIRSIDLVDILGRVIYSASDTGIKEISIELEKLSAGIYTLLVSTDSQNYFRKIIKD